MRLRITDTNGRALGALELDGKARSEDTRPRHSVRRSALLVGAGALGMAIVIGGTDGDTGTVSTLDTAAPVTAPVDTRPAALERVAPFSGSTYADAVGGWEHVKLEPSGDVTMNGVKVDSVYSEESPLRARYLATIDALGYGAGSDSSTVAEGVRYCLALERGDVQALREHADVTGLGDYGTTERRQAIASASTAHFCPSAR